MHWKTTALAALSALALTAVPTAALAQLGRQQLAADPGARAPATPAARSARQVVEISVTSAGFVPARIEVKKGQKVQLVVTRKTERTCATEIVIKDQGIHQSLPLNQPVQVEFTPKKSGEIRYACGMDMISGIISVQ